MIPQEKEISYEEFLEIDKESNDNLEFIDGKIYLLSAPSVIHQIVVTNLSTEFGNYFKGRERRHFVAPFDVVLKDEDKTHRVQPDLTVICDKEGLGEQNYTGVPVLVVKVLSPQNKTVQIFNLNEEDFYSEPIIYSKEDIVKSVIFKDLLIKLSDIFE